MRQCSEREARIFISRLHNADLSAYAYSLISSAWAAKPATPALRHKKSRGSAHSNGSVRAAECPLLTLSLSLIGAHIRFRESCSKNKHRIVSSETFTAHNLAHSEIVAIKDDSEGVLLSSPSHSCLSFCQASWMVRRMAVVFIG